MPATMPATMPHENATCYSSLNVTIRTEKARAFIEEEKRKRGCTKTALFNELLEVLADLPTFFSTPESSKLEELTALKKFLSDPVTERIPELAEVTRRDPLRMLLFVLDQGMRTIDAEQSSEPFHRIQPEQN